MTSLIFEFIEAIALAQPCEFCAAERKDWCKTASGKRAAFLHEPRCRLGRNAWRAAFVEGEAWGTQKERERAQRAVPLGPDPLKLTALCTVARGLVMNARRRVESGRLVDDADMLESLLACADAVEGVETVDVVREAGGGAAVPR